GPRRIVLESDELDVAVGPVLDEAIGAGADVLVDRPGTRGVDDFLRIDHRRWLGQRIEQRARWLLEADDDGIRILGLDALHAGPDDLAYGGDLPPALQRGHDVGGGQLLAVVELHATSQRDRMTQPAIAHGVTLGEHRNRVPRAVVREQRLVDVPHDL